MMNGVLIGRLRWGGGGDRSAMGRGGGLDGVSSNLNGAHDQRGKAITCISGLFHAWICSLM